MKRRRLLQLGLGALPLTLPFAGVRKAMARLPANLRQCLERRH